jgi:hypothetical protein
VNKQEKELLKEVRADLMHEASTAPGYATYVEGRTGAGMSGRLKDICFRLDELIGEEEKEEVVE